MLAIILFKQPLKELFRKGQLIVADNYRAFEIYTWYYHRGAEAINWATDCCLRGLENRYP
jgi:hypothetical protein